MNALEFLVNIKREKEITYTGENAIIRFPEPENEMLYFHMFREDDHYAYEYLTLTPREGKYEMFYYSFQECLEELTPDEQYHTIMKLQNIEVEYEPKPSYDEINKWYLYFATYEKYPLYSVRGTCNRENECKCKGESPYCKVHCAPCCSKVEVGCSATSIIKNPEYPEFVPELIVWMTWCPDMDVLYVMHDYPPVIFNKTELGYSFAFLLKDHKITYIEDEREIEKLYKEYHKRYPCDTSEVEESMNRWYGNAPDFHF